MNDNEKKLKDIKEIGLIPFVPLQGKLIKIKSYVFEKGVVNIVLESQYGEKYERSMPPREIIEFLNGFDLSFGKNLPAAQGTSDQTISKIREVLFDTLGKVQENKMEEKVARTINNISQTLLNSARIEIEFKKMKLQEKKKDNSISEK